MKIIECKISFINCFCDGKEDSGNPAAVVENFEGSDEQRQVLAARLFTSDQMPVTVFLQQGNNGYSIRCFYPTLEMNMCIHGTLASALKIPELSVSQGQSMGRPCRLSASYLSAGVGGTVRLREK
jgi:predicted PhzF superfamily epimerase YddE/YHI9